MPRNRKKDSKPKSLVDRISAAMLHNSGLFLRKAAQEIAGHTQSGNDPFDVDRATIVTVLIQTAVELASTAMVLKHEGFPGVVPKKDLPASDVEAEARWEDGTIRTLTFEELKPKAAKYLGNEDFWVIVEMLQKSRNKLVHFHTPLYQDDRFDLQYEVTNVLIQIVAALTAFEQHEFPSGFHSFFGAELFHRLISYEPYRAGIEARARTFHFQPLRCGACGAREYHGDDETCLSCGYSGEMKLLQCLVCKELAVFYDHLNLPLNDWLKARCGRCDWEGRAVHCAECDDDYLVEEHSLMICPVATSNWLKSNPSTTTAQKRLGLSECE